MSQKKICIKTEKFVDAAGCKARRILSIEGVLSAGELPAEYKKHAPYLFTAGDGSVYVELPEVEYLRPGTEFSEQRFQEVLGAIREAGDRLHEINKKIRELRSSWRGEETIIV